MIFFKTNNIQLITMKKLLLFCQLLLGALVMAQVNYSQNWNTTGLNGWTTSGSVFSNNTTANQICGTTGVQLEENGITVIRDSLRLQISRVILRDKLRCRLTTR
jgi:hypothetical protein